MTQARGSRLGPHGFHARNAEHNHSPRVRPTPEHSGQARGVTPRRLCSQGQRADGQPMSTAYTSVVPSRVGAGCLQASPRLSAARGLLAVAGTVKAAACDLRTSLARPAATARYDHPRPHGRGLQRTMIQGNGALAAQLTLTPATPTAAQDPPRTDMRLVTQQAHL